MKQRTIQYLEDIQSKYLIGMGTKLISPDEQIELVANQLKATSVDVEASEHILKRMKRAKTLSPSKYQDLVAYSQMLDAFEPLRETLIRVKLIDGDETKKQEFDIPIFGTMQTSDFNASVRPIPNTSEHLIIFNDTLFMFSSLIINCVVLATHPDKFIPSGMGFILPEPRNLFEPTNESVLKFIDCMLILSVYGNIYKDDTYNAGELYYPMVKCMEAGFYRFIAAHEYAHFVLGHPLKKEGRLSSKEVKQYKNGELEADELGIILAMQSMLHEGHDATISSLGICLCFFSFVLEQQLKNKIAGRDEDFFMNQFYPSPLERYIGFLKVMDGRFGIPPDMYYSLHRLINFYWSQFCDSLSDIHPHHGLEEVFSEISKVRDNPDMSYKYRVHAEIFHEIKLLYSEEE